ncbi:MAG: hypothetical protein II797_04365, partial [Clostridia bacterium]|nr:hypothetical protein [Clostridia bacterium]
IPAYYHGHRVNFSVSHLTPAFYHIIEHGTDGYREKILSHMDSVDDYGKEVLSAMLKTIEHIEIYHERYMEALRAKAKDDPRYEANLRALEKVPMAPPTNFREAVQSLWFSFAFMRLIGNWPSVGRIDAMLGPYLKKDLEDGRITIDEARELLAHFMIKGCEWVCGDVGPSGDAQHYQNIVLGGLDEDGNVVTNEVTFLILEIVEELPIADFPIAVKLSASHPDKKLIRKMAEVIRHGGGVVAAYNNDMIVDELVRYGYDVREARIFANDGCWEIQVPGKTLFSYTPFDGLQILQKYVLKLDQKEPAHYDSIEEILDKYREGLFAALKTVYQIRVTQNFDTFDIDPTTLWKHSTTPSIAVSMLEDGCIESGRTYFEGGTKYRTFSAHIGGAPDAADAIYAIQKLVFEEKRVSFDEFMEILQNNWEGHEDLRAYVRNHYSYFGNDNDEVDQILARIVSDFRDACDWADTRNTPFRITAGISTFGRQIDWKDMRLASPHGYRTGDILASNISPTPGTDRIGATAVIRSACKLPMDKMTCGAALDIKLTPESVQGEDGVKAIMSLFEGFVALGGSF